MIRIYCYRIVVLAITSCCLLFMACSSGKKSEPDLPRKSDYIIIPLGGNAYVRSADVGTNSQVTDNGISWSNPSAIFDVYFRVNKATNIKLMLELLASSDSVLRVSALNKTGDFSLKAGGNYQLVDIGEYSVVEPGYVKMTLELASGTSPRISNLGVHKGNMTNADLNFAPTEDNMMYWGRRGPSVHLNYTFPAGTDIEWFYSEILIQEGNDVIGSYYMANGGDNFYFGMQVNSATERRMLFSVWAPYATDNPNEIPANLRTERLEAGQGIQGDVFGGEGSGTQSYLIYTWETGVTYKFLTRVRPMPDGSMNTLYTSFFFDPIADQWRLMATIRRPTARRYYTRPYSFLENFVTHTGQFTRRGLFGNHWARSKEGQWTEITRAAFTNDDTARQGARMDYLGGTAGNYFFLQNCGFFNQNTPYGTSFTRPSLGIAPVIDFNGLPTNYR